MYWYSRYDSFINDFFCFKKIKIKAEIVLSPGGAYFQIKKRNDVCTIYVSERLQNGRAVPTSKEAITQHDRTTIDTLKTEQQLNTNKTPAKHRDIFRDTLFAKSMAKERIEPTTYCLGNTKKFQAPARVRNHDLLAGKAISEVHFTSWSGDKVEFWQNLYKKNTSHHDFPPSPIYVGGK